MSIKQKYISILLTLVTTLLCTVTLILPVYAASSEYAAQLNQQINRGLNGGNLSRLSYSNLDLNSDHPNLYMTIYNESIRNADDAAIEGMAIVTGYNKSDIRRFIDEGYAGFVDVNGDVNAQQQAIESLNYLYRQEKDFFRDLAKLENETIALEIFTNGNERDAGFDLLSDLKKIEKILYSDVESSQFGPEINLGGSFLDRVGANRSKFSSLTNIPSSGNGSGSTQTSGSTSNSNSSTEGVSSGTGSAPGDEETDYCQVDPTLYDALNTYDEEQQAASSSNGSSSNSGANSNATSRNSSGATDNSTFKNLLNDNPIKPFTDNSRKCPDNQVFCFYVERIMATAESYFAEDRQCVACVASDMRLTTDEILSQSLTPQKVTGQFLEPNLCKNAAFNRKFNLQVSLLPRPVLPSQDISDSVTETSPAQAAQSLSFRANGFTESSRTNAAQSGDASLLQVGDSQNYGAAYEEDVNFRYRSVPGITRDLASLSELNNSVLTRYDSFANYIVSLQGLAEEIRTTLIAIKSKPQCSAL